jgi:hypothetical protein
MIYKIKKSLLVFLKTIDVMYQFYLHLHIGKDSLITMGTYKMSSISQQCKNQ